MKKIITLILAVVLIVSTGAVCYGQSLEPAVEEIQLRYVATNDHYEAFSIESNGKAVIKTTLWPKVGYDMDKVLADIKIKNTGTNEIIFDERCSLTYSSLTGKFEYRDNLSLAKRGRYQMDVTYHCYNGTTKYETITAAPIQDTY